MSVIIPTYNRADCLDQTLQSVIASDWQPQQILLCDDGSTDGTRELIRRYESNRGTQVKYLPLAHSGLPAVARNHGIRIATGDYVAFLDSDDCWLPDKLRKQVEGLEKTPNVGLSCSNAYRVAADRDLHRERFFASRDADKAFHLPALLAENSVITSSVVLRRSVLDQTGWFSEDPNLLAVEDWDLWLRVATISEIAYLDAPLLLYRDAPLTSVRSEQSKLKYWESAALIYERQEQFLLAHGRLTPPVQVALERLRRRTAKRVRTLRRRYERGGEQAATTANMLSHSQRMVHRAVQRLVGRC